MGTSEFTAINLTMTSEASGSISREVLDPNDENRAHSMVNARQWELMQGAASVRNERDEALRKIKLLERNLATLRVSAAKTARDLELTNQEIVESARYRLEAEAWTDSEGEGKVVDGEDRFGGQKAKERLQAGLGDSVHSAGGGGGRKSVEDSERLKQATEGYCVQTKALLRRSIAATDVVVADMIRAKKDAGRHKAKSEQLERTVYKLDAMLKQSHTRHYRQPQTKMLLKGWILRQKHTVSSAVVRCWSVFTRQAITKRVVAEARIRRNRRLARGRAALQAWRRHAGQVPEKIPHVEAPRTTQIALEEEIVLLKATRDQLEADKAGLRVECERASKALRDRDDRLREMQETAIGDSAIVSELTAEKARTASLQARLEEAAARVAQFQSMLERNEGRAGTTEEFSSGEAELPDGTFEAAELRARVEELELQLREAEDGYLERDAAGRAGGDMTEGPPVQDETMLLQLTELEEERNRYLRMNEVSWAEPLYEKRMGTFRNPTSCMGPWPQSLSAEKAVVDEELERVRAEMRGLVEANEELRKAAEGSQARETKLTEELVSKNEAEVQQTKLVETLGKETAKLRKELEVAEEEGKMRAEALKSERDGLVARVKGLEVQLKGYAAEEESNRLEVKRVVEETDKLKALLEEARMEITRHEKEASESSECMAEIAKEKQRLKSEKAALEKEVEDMRGRLEEAKEQLKNVQEVVERAKEESDGMMESMRTKLEEEHARVAEGMAEAHREKVAAMSATIDALQAKIRDLEVAEDAGGRAEERESELEREAEELRRKFGDREGELEEKIAEISARLEAVQEELEMRGTALSTAEERLEEHIGLLSEARQELSMAKTEQTTMEDRARKTSEDLQQSLVRMEEAERKVLELETIFKRIETEKAQLLQENTAMGERIEAFEGTATDGEALTSQLNDAKGQLENLQTENNELVERVKELEMAKSTLADDMWKQEVCVKEAETGRQAAEVATREAEQELVILRAQLEQMATRVEEGTAALESSKEKCNELERSLKETITSDGNRESELSQECTRLTEAMAEMEGKMAEATTLAEARLGEITSLQETVDKLHTDVQRKEDEKEDLERSTNDLRFAMEEKELALETLRDAMSKLEAEQKAWAISQEERRAQLDEARGEIEALRNQTEIDGALREEVAELHREARAAQELIASLKQQLEAAQDEISRLTAELEETKASVEARVEEARTSSGEQGEKYLATIRELEAEKREVEDVAKQREILNDWATCDWSGKDLRAGQKVGLLVSKSPVDQLFILVDGAVVADGPRSIPTGKPLYGVVDLIGSTSAVLLSDPETTPLPPAALELVPKVSLINP
ncbi:RAD50 DNA repair protein, putative [Perkinsus marinus ATCC 50983]|uniref:RAD50 DNA repair protein, putative n=1 Tax=Perkinsus marinus (strain ATCC 50983 / TXsc) TaxID=423536 RepID=C5LDI8_PERM5|nr:RAD50 DNA repair protein, putative [Perkinsus marinus ATCC 50983]EER05320.1 RAD50 DNA repair protein, putative [Perkinsus marinus ATCC 50983]|eukprot:XP_002773504.1 RAD50 DNA repair protein, putative [Perkinsus marinus ATCC 50983]